MPVSVPLSYERAVYFLIKNVQFILGSVKVAEWPPFAITRFMLSHTILCALCKWSMLFIFFPIRILNCILISMIR